MSRFEFDAHENHTDTLISPRMPPLRRKPPASEYDKAASALLLNLLFPPAIDPRTILQDFLDIIDYRIVLSH